MTHRIELELTEREIAQLRAMVDDSPMVDPTTGESRHWTIVKVLQALPMTSPISQGLSEEEPDPTPWCNACGARTKARCDCGPIADNE